MPCTRKRFFDLLFATDKKDGDAIFQAIFRRFRRRQQQKKMDSKRILDEDETLDVLTRKESVEKDPPNDKYVRTPWISSHIHDGNNKS